MYMTDFLDLDFDNDFVFMNDDKGTLSGGGFILNSELLKETINNNNTDNNDSDNNFQTGGTALTSSVILKSLKDLAVPAGLLYTQKNLQKNKLIKYENKGETIDNSIYDKLLSIVDVNSKKQHAIKTRKKREKKSKMSRKLK
jgi:hypothetical protein